jgi:hypothetical protein
MGVLLRGETRAKFFCVFRFRFDILRRMPSDPLQTLIDLLADAIAARIGKIEPRRGPGRPPGSVNRIGKRIRRTEDDLAQISADLLAYVADNPGRRMEQISKAMGASTKELQLPVRKLVAEKKLKTKGQKRATEYFRG